MEQDAHVRTAFQAAFQYGRRLYLRETGQSSDPELRQKVLGGWDKPKIATAPDAHGAKETVIFNALKMCNGNATRAAKLCGISRCTAHKYKVRMKWKLRT